MNIVTATIRKFHDDEGGAALVMVLLITILLVTASAAMLSAVGASSRNNADALSEAKAYWAAESGLQATIHQLRFGGPLGKGIDYTDAAADTDLSTWLNYAPGDPTRVEISTEEAYQVSVSDPDGTGARTTFNSTGAFRSQTTQYAATYTWPGPTPVPDPSATPDPNPTPNPNYTQISWIDPVGDTEVDHGAPPASSLLGTFHIESFGTGGTLAPITFKIDYRTTLPFAGVRSLRGKIALVGTEYKLDFDADSYELAGAPIILCPDAACATPGSFAGVTINPPVGGSQDIPVFIKVGSTEPTRLKVVATGYGPRGAKKQLEAIIQKNYFNNFSVANAITMVGPTNCMVFVPGTSTQMNIDGGNAPSVGVADDDGVDMVNAAHTNGTMNPPPDSYGDELPDWQSSPTLLNNLVNDLRAEAKRTRRYFENRSPTNAEGWGDFATGTGLTFCEGSCTMSGNNEGGGILVITGTFYTSGNPKFKGMVLAVGPYRSSTNPGGIVRGGGGNELFTGGLVIAPYFPENLAAGFGCPRYEQNGGPGDTTNQALDETFNETEAVTNVVRGVAEK